MVLTAKICNWPLCLTLEQGILLAKEISIEERTGEPCGIYAERYPEDRRTICGCEEPPRGVTPEGEPSW